jgi:CRISPR-associated protein Cas1
MKRIIDISQDNRHLSKYRGFLVVSQDTEEIARVALDDILAVIVHSHGVTYSNSVLCELAERGSIVVLCGPNHFPIAYMGAINGHHSQAGRISDQLNTKLPLKKNLWRLIVQHKISMQAAVLNAHQKNSSRLEMFVRNVKSGDSTNIEAQAARTYWPLLMGSDFKRDQQKMGINSLLNYGYTILRATVARSIIASGLHPSVGLHHSNKLNSFVLADDLVEPFRPLVDYISKSLLVKGKSDLSGSVKRSIARVIEYELNINNTQSSVSNTIQYLCNSLVHSFNVGKPKLDLFAIPTPMELSALSQDNGTEQ